MNSPLNALGLLGSGNALVVSLPKSFNLRKELMDANEIRLATAFAHWSGWRSIRPYIQGGASVKLLTGLSFCQTEPRVLTDWWQLAKTHHVEARLFVNKRVTFHPKVLIVSNLKRRFVVVGSGNLSAGGFLNNLECSLYSDDTHVFQQLIRWFDNLFENETLTKELHDRDIGRYRPKFAAARSKNRAIRRLQEDAEEDIGERHRAGLGKWNQAVALAKRFFASKAFKDHYKPNRAQIGDEIKSTLRYPHSISTTTDWIISTRYFHLAT